MKIGGEDETDRQQWRKPVGRHTYRDRGNKETQKLASRERSVESETDKHTDRQTNDTEIGLYVGEVGETDDR